MVGKKFDVDYFLEMLEGVTDEDLLREIYDNISHKPKYIKEIIIDLLRMDFDKYGKRYI